MARTLRSPASTGTAILFGLFVGASAAGLLAVGVSLAGFALTVPRLLGVAAVGLGLALVAGKGLLLV
jgi:hypothetical protein